MHGWKHTYTHERPTSGPGVLRRLCANTLCDSYAQEAETAARRFIKWQRAYAACEAFRADAVASEAAWQALQSQMPNTAALVAHVERVKALVTEAWPDKSSQPAIVHETRAAFNSAIATANVAQVRVQATVSTWRAAVEVALVAVRDHALAAVAAWEDRPPSSDETQGLSEAIQAAKAALNAHPGMHRPSTLQQANQAIAQAWAAADAARAAHAERALAAQHALDTFTQRALLCRAAWARAGRRRPPKVARYEKLQAYYSFALCLAERAFPEAHEYVLRAEREPGAQPDHVPGEEMHAVRLMQDAKNALESVEGLVRAWEYATVMQQAAVAA